MKPIDFWYSIGSTYSYLTVMRLDEVAQEHGAEVTWRPFNVRTIMTEQKNIPFAGKPEKSAYMWRDIERRAAKYGLPISVPAPYPIPELQLANQVALLGMLEGWGRAFTVQSYRQWFEDGLPAGSEPNLSTSLTRVGQDPAQVLERAASPEAEQALVDQTILARDAGVFGAPSFLVEGELFWGDDRLEDALVWARDGHL